MFCCLPGISHLLATDPHAPTMPRPPQPRRLPRLSGYSRSLAQSARAYDGRSSRGSKIADVAEETETPSPVTWRFVSGNGGLLKNIPIGSMYGIYAIIGGIWMLNVTIYSIHGSYGIWQFSVENGK